MFTTLLTLALLVPQTVTKEPSAPLQLSWYHDGQKGPKFRIWRKGVIVLNVTSDHVTVEPAELINCQPEAVACFLYTTKPLVLPTPTPGIWVYEVGAYNEFGDAAKSDAVTLTVAWTSAPAKALGLTFK
jgi:hypothetical protein